MPKRINPLTYIGRTLKECNNQILVNNQEHWYIKKQHYSKGMWRVTIIHPKEYDKRNGSKAA